MNTNNEELILCAYAVLNGYTVGPSTVSAVQFDDKGLPKCPLTFKLGRVAVWDTARGFRCAQFGDDGMMIKTDEPEFYRKLKDALDAGIALHNS